MREPNNHIIKWDLDGHMIYEDNNTRWFDKMIGNTKYTIFVLENLNLDREKRQLQTTLEAKENYIQQQIKRMKGVFKNEQKA